MDSTEKIVDAIYGIFKNHKTGYDAMRLKGISIGTVYNTENTIFITNERLLFISVPVLGGGKMIEGFDVSMLQSSFNSKGIAERGEQMRNTMTPQAILESDKSNFELPFNMIASFKIRTFWGRGVTLIDTRGQKYTYAIRNSNDLLRLGSILNQNGIK